MLCTVSRLDHKGGHEPCLCGAVAGLRPVTPSPRGHPNKKDFQVHYATSRLPEMRDRRCKHSTPRHAAQRTRFPACAYLRLKFKPQADCGDIFALCLAKARHVFIFISHAESAEVTTCTTTTTRRTPRTPGITKKTWSPICTQLSGQLAEQHTFTGL